MNEWIYDYILVFFNVNTPFNTPSSSSYSSSSSSSSFSYSMLSPPLTLPKGKSGVVRVNQHGLAVNLHLYDLPRVLGRLRAKPGTG